jgi:plastocyanin
MFTTFFSLGLVLLPFASAAVVHDIQVGASQKLQFSPEAISAQPGDQVVFHFASKNHTVTQSSFAGPCGPKDGGFDSGFMPVAANQTDNLPTFTINVTDMQPVWVYCRQKTPVNHCGQGMVFAVNCPQDGSPNSFTNFKKAALAIGAAEASAAPSPTAGASSPAPPAYGGSGGSTDPSSPAPSTNSSSPAPSPVSGAPSVVHTVLVGESGSLAFSPSSLKANPGDVVLFEFRQKNHAVTRSSFGAPCDSLSANGTSGFDSGFMPVSSTSGPFPTWNLTVNDTTPIWAFCRQATPVNHCGAGMVFAINAVDNGPKNFTAFQNGAKAASGSTAANSTTGDANSALSTRLNTVTVAAALFAALALLL